MAATRRANKVALAKLIADRLNISASTRTRCSTCRSSASTSTSASCSTSSRRSRVYNAIRAHPTRDLVPRVKIFAGKAAASYQQAKLIIKLDHRRGARWSTTTRPCAAC